MNGRHLLRRQRLPAIDTRHLARETVPELSNCYAQTASPLVLRASVGWTITTNPGSGNGQGSIGERAVDVQVNRLRRKIERDPANPLLLQTVRGIGYRLVNR